MTEEEQQYTLAQSALAAAAVAYATRFVGLFLTAPLSKPEWLKMLALIFPVIAGYQRQSAENARQFYDSQRAKFYPDLPRHDVFLVEPSFEEFTVSMEPFRVAMQQPNTRPSVVTQFGMGVARQVELAGRRQIVESVESDEAVAEVVELFEQEPEPPQLIVVRRNIVRRSPPPVPVQLEPERVPDLPPVRRSGLRLAVDNTRPVQGWARIATGRETCAWCLMLVSRGPVYKSAETAGALYDDDTVMAALAKDAEVTEFMNQWHIGCDCKVVPVFDANNWPGMDAQRRAEELWIQASKDAEDVPARVHLTGKNKGQPFTKNEEIILALRRRIERGEISPQDWAILRVA